jgi:hypothetical protein
MSSLTITSVSLVILRRRRLRPALFREPGNVPRQANAQPFAKLHRVVQRTNGPFQVHLRFFTQKQHRGRIFSPISSFCVFLSGYPIVSDTCADGGVINSI